MAANAEQGNSHIKKMAIAARVAAQHLQWATTAERRGALEGYKRGLLRFRDEIERANTEDLQVAAASVASGDLAESLYRRLDCRGSKFSSLVAGLDQLIAMSPDPVGRCEKATELCENLHLYRVSCPIGVVAVIYEARPEAAVQIAGLALKSGNAVILKGGKEACRTNKAIFRALRWGLTHGTHSNMNHGITAPVTTFETNALPRYEKSEEDAKDHAKAYPGTLAWANAGNASMHGIAKTRTTSKKRKQAAIAEVVRKTSDCTGGIDETSEERREPEIQEKLQKPRAASAEGSKGGETPGHFEIMMCTVPVDCLQMIEERQEVAELLALEEYVDLVIPRGSKSLVQYVKSHTKIPVLGHADGLCTLYVDAAGDVEKAVRVILDSKLQYPAACNAIETLLVHKGIAAELLPALARAAAATPLKFKADEIALPLLLSGSPAAGTEEAAVETKAELRRSTGGKTDTTALVEPEATAGKGSNRKEQNGAERVVAADEADFTTEWLAPVLAVKTVYSLKEAIEHINTHGSHHTDCIVTESHDAAEVFLRAVDSAGVYHNCSTRFADGYRYGFGAEVGISTNRIHARGPVGVEGLLTYKYRLYGKGHTVDDVAKGKTKFTHKNLKLPGDAHEQGLDTIEDVAKRQRHL